MYINIRDKRGMTVLGDVGSSSILTSSARHGAFVAGHVVKHAGWRSARPLRVRRGWGKHC